MGFLDALTADAWPRDTLGRRVFAPFGMRGRAYILPAERATQLARRQRRYFVALFLAMGAALFVGPWGILTVAMLGIGGFLVLLSVSTNGLEESTERPTMPRAEAVDRAMHAMGRPTMWAICLAGAATCTSGTWWLLRGERGVAIWFLTIYGAVVCLLYAWKLFRFGIASPAT